MQAHTKSMTAQIEKKSRGLRRFIRQHYECNGDFTSVFRRRDSDRDCWTLKVPAFPTNSVLLGFRKVFGDW
jgi:hypothetical protein